MEKHQGEEIEAKPEVKIKKPKPASLEEEQKKLLSQIIDEVNALYDKDYEPDFTTKAAMQIRDLLLKNAALKERLEKSAKTIPSTSSNSPMMTVSRMHWLKVMIRMRISIRFSSTMRKSVRNLPTSL